MKHFRCNGLSGISGTVTLPGDKSIAHRALILGALSPHRTIISNFPVNKDCRATIAVFARLGIRITARWKALDATTVTVFGRGLRGLSRPKRPIHIEESGTTIRLLLGVLAGQDFKTKITAGRSLVRRPMKRVTEPLRLMGARIRGQYRSIPLNKEFKGLSSGMSAKEDTGAQEEYLPITIQGGNLKAITYRMPVASAQVKSAILLAGLYACGRTKIIEPVMTRDHTERLLKQFGANIKHKANEIVVSGCTQLASPRDIYVPGDISSASFFIVLGCLAKQAKITVTAVSLNPSRLGIIKVLKRMGADIQITRAQEHMSTSHKKSSGGEPMGDIRVKTSVLKACTIKKEEVPSLIDELPVLMVAASLAKGTSVFEGVQELRVKETDRIESMMTNLKAMGVNVQVMRASSSIENSGDSSPRSQGRRTQGIRAESVVIKGVPFLRGTQLKSFQDHRTAMSMVIAGLCASGTTDIDDVSCISKSFPGFLKTLKILKTVTS